MESIVVETELEVSDWEALQGYVTRRVMEPGRWRLRDWLTTLVLPIVVSGALTWYALDLLGSRRGALGIIFGAFICAVAMIGIPALRLKRFRPAPGSYIFARTRLELDATGLRSTRQGQTGFTVWNLIERIDETAEHFFFSLDRLTAYVVPKRVITSVTPEEFGARVRAWHAAPASPSESTVASGEPVIAAPVQAQIVAEAPVASASQPGFWRSLKGNLIAGLRVFLIRRVAPNEFVSTFDQVVALLGVLVVIAALLDWERAEPGSRFAYYAVSSWAVWLLFGVGACALMARSLSPRADTRALLVVALAVMPWVIVTLWAFEKVPFFSERYTLQMLTTMAVLLPVCFRVVLAAYGFLRPVTFFVIVLVVFGVSGLERYFFVSTHLWITPPDPSEEMTDWTATESTLFDQPIRISEVVEGLEPERPGVTDVFFVGFAGDGSQRVFRREVLFGQQVFAKAMGSGTRSVTFINDYEDRLTYPLATATSLRYGLELLGRRMNSEEDVLVLFLTSHGSRESGIAVQNGIMPLNDVGPEEVLRALDASGVKWRIVIVSACYAGVFIEPLKSDTTLVITAADPDRNSFGCADDRDLTYFGEEFLRDALPVSPSLEEAFQTARVEIERRERAEKKTPSHPQIHVGDAIREKLAALGRLPLK